MLYSYLPGIMLLCSLIQVHGDWELLLHNIIVFWHVNLVNYLAKPNTLPGLISIRKRGRRIG